MTPLVPKFCPQCGNEVDLDPELWENEDGQNGPNCRSELKYISPLSILRRVVEVGEIVCEFSKYGFRGINDIGVDMVTIFADGSFGCRGSYEYESDYIQFPIRYLELDNIEIRTELREQVQQKLLEEQRIKQAEETRRQQLAEAASRRAYEALKAKYEGKID